MEKKDSTLLIVLIILSVIFIMIPLKITDGWHFIIQLIIYGAISYILIKLNQPDPTNQESNKAPNSNLQIAIWTILFASLLSTTFAHNLHNSNCFSDALDIKIPSGYWILLGISGITSAVQTVTPIKKNIKEGLFYNHKITSALIETENSEGKSLQFFKLEIDSSAIERIQFTLFLLITSIAFLLFSFQYLGTFTTNCITELPKISDTIAILSSISNGVYLAPKVLKIS